MQKPRISGCGWACGVKLQTETSGVGISDSAEDLCDDALSRRLRDLPMKPHAGSLAAEERATRGAIMRRLPCSFQDT